MQTQEHVARLCFAGSVGLKLVTGGQNLSNRDHTRQTLTEENRIPETKGSGGKEREWEQLHVCSTHCALCRGDNKTQVRHIMDLSKRKVLARGKTILQNKRGSDDQQALTVVMTLGTCRQLRVPRVLMNSDHLSPNCGVSLHVTNRPLVALHLGLEGLLGLHGCLKV